MGSTNAVGFMFGLGHGHYAQFLNFQECCPPGYAGRAIWVPLDTAHPSTWIERLPIIPAGLRYRLHQTRNAYRSLRRSPRWDALFIANVQLMMIPLLARHRCYGYLDFTPSLKRELAPWYEHQLTKQPLLRMVRERAMAALHRMFHGIFVMSRWAARGVAADYGLPPERVHVALPGANLRRWPLIDRQRASRRGPTRILMVGGEFRRKGGDLLLRWAEETRATGWELDMVTWPGELPDWVANSLGNPAPNARVSGALAPRLPNVRVHCGMKANTPELMDLFRQADIFCLPTNADGSSIASLEAMASGLPVVVGAVGGIPELIDHGRTGFLMRPGDMGDLNAQLGELIADADLRRRIGLAAYQACASYYNVTRQLHEIFQVIDADVPAKQKLGMAVR